MTDAPTVIDGIVYDEDADIQTDDSGMVINHDELVNAGKTTREIRAVNDEAATRVADSMLIEPSDDEYRDAFADMDPGDVYRGDDIPS